MNDLEKLRIMLPHWIEHNKGHGEEFFRWADTLAGAGEEEIAELLREAVKALHEAHHALAKALEKAGGPIEKQDGHHGHHHH
ncbi:hypothetical protein [Desulfolithobacter sp.]